jgi:putative ABC transport system permease protein
MRGRWGAHAGLWLLVGTLGVATVFTAASVGPLVSQVEDTGLRQMLDAAPYTTRDLISTRPARSPQEATRMRAVLDAGLPGGLRDVVGHTWEYYATQVVPGEGAGAALTGNGVATSEFGLAPVVTLHHQVGLVDELSMVDGRSPATPAGTDVPEVMVSGAVAGALGLAVGGEYALHPGLLAVMRHPDTGDWATASGLLATDEFPALTVRVTGVFEAADRAHQVWDHLGVLEPSFVTIPVGDPPHPPAPRGALVTDENGFGVLIAHEAAAAFHAIAGVRLRLDSSLLDAGWASQAPEAVARTATDPELSQVPVTTGLVGLLADYQRGAAAARAVVAVATAGVLATLVGLLVLATRLIMDRRRTEWGLLRARGGSLVAVVTRVAAEAAPVAVVAAVVGWLLHRLAVGGPVWGWPGADHHLVWLAAGAATVLVWLVVPTAAAVAVRRVGAAASGRDDLGTTQAHPARWSAEVAVVALAGLGYLLVRQRGLAVDGVDPYLSAVPVLLAVAAGVVALRLYPWPVRALAAMAGRLRGLVGFVGLARAGRSAPGAALALLVLVLAVTVGGFAGAVTGGVADARQAGAVQSLGAHLRVSVADLPDGAAAAVAAVPGVETVVVTVRGGVAREAPVRAGRALPRRDVQGVQVVMVDAVAYQELLAGLGVATRLPAEVLVAPAEGSPLPVLASPAVADRTSPTVWIGDVERPVVPVGGVADLPGPDRDRPWVLVPAQAWPEPGTEANATDRSVTQVAGYELLVAGAGADPEAVRAAVAGLPEAGEVTVVSLAEVRAGLEESGFNAGLTLVLVVGTVGAAVGGVLAVALALVVQARVRGRTLSLLRTMGLSSRQARGLLLVEVLPPTALAVVVGAVTGAGLPVLFGAALGLDRFTGGVPVEFGVQPGAVAVLAGIVLGLLVAGTMVEAGINRVMGLGRALRVE